MYYKFRKVDLKISKHIYIDIFDDKLITTFSMTNHFDYSSYYVIATPKQEEYVKYLIDNDLVKITYTETLLQDKVSMVGYWLKLAPKALLNAL